MDFTNRGQSFNDKFKSNLDPITLNDFSEIVKDDHGAWNICNLEEVEVLLLNIIKIKEIIPLITREYFFTTKFDIISKTFYFSHPITYCLQEASTYRRFDSNRNLLIVDYDCLLHFNCYCARTRFFTLTRSFVKVYDCLIKFQCKHKKRRNHDSICWSDSCLHVSNGDDQFRSIYVFHKDKNKFISGFLTNCNITTYGGVYYSGIFHPRWEIE